jgi:hypothetical protein
MVVEPPYGLLGNWQIDKAVGRCRRRLEISLEPGSEFGEKSARIVGKPLVIG